MSIRKVDVSIVTFNTLVDACARCGRMDQLSGIQEEMEKVGVQPNLITYSAMIKGYCRMRDIQKAFDILNHMRREGGVRPDEITYNSLLDGCAQNNLVEEGMKLLEEMQQEGVKPSNFTLSVLVKMMSRSRNLDGAFSIVEEMASKHGLRPNVHVYTNLIVACLSRKTPERAMRTLERMARERVQPDARAYTALVQGCLQAGQPDKAAGLLRAALRLPDPIAVLKDLAPSNISLDPAFVNECILGLAQCGRAQDLAASLISDIQKHNTRIRIEPSTRRCVTEGWEAPDRASARGPRQRLQQKPQGSRTAW